MKKSLKNLLIVGLVISSNGLVGSEKPGLLQSNNYPAKLGTKQKAVRAEDGTFLYTPVGQNTPTNTNPTRLQQVATAITNWWNKQ